jgi:hypothetical protein
MAKDDTPRPPPRRWAQAVLPRPARPGRPPRAAHPLRATLIGAVLFAYAWADATAAPFTTRSLVGVLIPGAVLGAIACGKPPERIPPPRELDITGTSYWLICILALFEWEASAFRDNSLPWHPSLTNLLDPVLGPHVMKSAAIAVWLAVGWGLVKR